MYIIIYIYEGGGGEVVDKKIAGPLLQQISINKINGREPENFL